MRCHLLAPGAEIARRSRRHARASLLPLLAAAAGASTPARAAEAPVYETVVTAPPAPPEAAREDASASASVITADRTPRSGETLPQLLSELPGVAVTRYGSHGALAAISLRGSSPNQVLVYADGVPLDSAVTGAIDLGLLPLTGADRIEVYRGSSPLSFGGSAIGGVVVLTTEAPRASGLSASGGLGSFETRCGGAEAAWVGARWRLLGRASFFDSRSDFPYRSDNRTLFDPSDDRTLRRQNNQLRQLDAALRATLALPGRRQLVAALGALDRQQGLPARATDDSFETTLARRRVHGSVSYEGREDLGAGSRLKATLYSLLGEQRFDDPLGEIAFTPTATRDRSLSLGGTALAEHQTTRVLRLSAMLDGRHEALSPHVTMGQARRLPGSRSFGAGGLGAGLWAERLGLDVYANVRLEAAHDVISPDGLFGPGQMERRPANYLLPVARLGLVQQPAPAVLLRANIGRYARLPSLFERYGNAGRVRGNAQLRPERGLGADLGGTFTHAGPRHRVSLDGAVFASRSEDLISFQSAGYFSEFVNVDRARVLGAELSASASASRVAYLFLQGTYTDARDVSGISGHDGHQLPHRPRVRAYARPEARDLPLGAWTALGFYADVDVTGARYEDPANLVRIPARVLFGAGASLRFRPAGVRAVLSAYNLGDVRSTDVVEFPLPGRSFYLTLHFSYPAKNIEQEMNP
jgi:iron complex outermembrane receptor protein